MTITDGYVTLSEVQRWTGVAVPQDTSTIERIVETASRAIDALCGRRFVLDASASARVYGPESLSADRTVLRVDDIGTTAGLAVAVDDNADGTFETPVTDIEVRPRGLLWQGRSWPVVEIVALDRYWPAWHRRGQIQVTARWGWPSVPPEVRQACLVACADLLKLRDAPWGLAGWGDYGAVRVRENPEVQRLLRPFMLFAGVA